MRATGKRSNWLVVLIKRLSIDVPATNELIENLHGSARLQRDLLGGWLGATRRVACGRGLRKRRTKENDQGSANERARAEQHRTAANGIWVLRGGIARAIQQRAVVARGFVYCVRHVVFLPPQGSRRDGAVYA